MQLREIHSKLQRRTPESIASREDQPHMGGSTTPAGAKYVIHIILYFINLCISVPL